MRDLVAEPKEIGSVRKGASCDAPAVAGVAVAAEAVSGVEGGRLGEGATFDGLVPVSGGVGKSAMGRMDGGGEKREGACG